MPGPVNKQTCALKNEHRVLADFQYASGFVVQKFEFYHTKIFHCGDQDERGS